jgi:hypothetical protein
MEAAYTSGDVGNTASIHAVYRLKGGIKNKSEPQWKLVIETLSIC